MTYMESWKAAAKYTGEYGGAAAPEVLQHTKMALHCSLKVIYLKHLCVEKSECSK